MMQAFEALMLPVVLMSFHGALDNDQPPVSNRSPVNGKIRELIVFWVTFSTPFFGRKASDQPVALLQSRPGRL
jgi:hypothetical protein